MKKTEKRNIALSMVPEFFTKNKLEEITKEFNLTDEVKTMLINELILIGLEIDKKRGLRN